MLDMTQIAQEVASVRDRLADLIREQAHLEGLKYQVKALAVARLMETTNPSTAKPYSATAAQTYATLDPTYGEWYRHYTTVKGAREVLELEMVTLRVIGLAVVGTPNNVLTPSIFGKADKERTHVTRETPN